MGWCSDLSLGLRRALPQLVGGEVGERAETGRRDDSSRAEAGKLVSTAGKACRASLGLYCLAQTRQHSSSQGVQVLRHAASKPWLKLLGGPERGGEPRREAVRLLLPARQRAQQKTESPLGSEAT